MSRKYNYFDDESTNDTSSVDIKGIAEKALSTIKSIGEKGVAYAKAFYIALDSKNESDIDDTADEQDVPIEEQLDNIIEQWSDESARILESKSKEEEQEPVDEPKPKQPKKAQKSKPAPRQRKPRADVEIKINHPKLVATISMLLLFVIVVVAIMLTFFGTISREQNREERFNAAAEKICTQYENDYGVCNYESLGSYGVSGYRMTGLCYAREIDFDNDNISELLLCYKEKEAYKVEVWGFDGKEFVRMYKGNANTTGDIKDDAWITLYKHNNKTYIATHDSDDLSKVTTYALHGTKFEQKSMAVYDIVTEQFFIGKKDYSTSFDRIRMSVLRELSASINSEKTLNTIDEFCGEARQVAVNSGKTREDNMKAAYYDIVVDYNDRFGCAEYCSEDKYVYIDGLAVVDLVDFNADGTDELVLVYRRQENQRAENARGEYYAVTVDKYFMDVYSWNGTNAFMVYQNDGLGRLLNDENQQYYIVNNKGKKKYLCFNSFSYSNYGRYLNATSKTMMFDGTRFKTKLKASYRTEYGYTYYYIDGDRVTSNTFAQKGGYNVPFFDGKSYADEDDDNYSIVYLRTDLSHSFRLDTRTQDTIDSIKKLDSSYTPAQ